MSGMIMKRLWLWLLLVGAGACGGVSGDADSQCESGPAGQLCLRWPQQRGAQLTLDAVQTNAAGEVTSGAQELMLAGAALRRGADAAPVATELVVVLQGALDGGREIPAALSNALGELVAGVLAIPGSRAALLSYGCKVQGLAAAEPAPLASDRARLSSEIKGARWPETTCRKLVTAEALERALGLLARSTEGDERRRMILLISDAAELKDTDAARLADLRERARRARVAVALVAPPRDEVSPTIVPLLRATGGTLRTCQDEEGRARALTQVLTELRAPRQVYQLPSANPRSGVLTLRAVGPLVVTSTLAPRSVDPLVRRAAVLLLWAVLLSSVWPLWELWQQLRSRRSSRRALGSLAFLVDLEGGLTHEVTHLPYAVGNDIDCDLVLPGVEQALRGFMLRRGPRRLGRGHRRSPSLEARPLGAGAATEIEHQGHPLQGPVRLFDKDELRVGGTRLRLFLVRTPENLR